MSTKLPEELTFIIDTETGESEPMSERDEPDQEWIKSLISECERQHEILWQEMRRFQTRQHQVAQLWLAGVALFTAGGLFSGLNVDLVIALGFGIGFLAAIAGLQPIPGFHAGVALSDFNGWAELRRATTQNSQVLLSTWQWIIEKADKSLAERGKWLKLSLLLLGAWTVAALTLKLITQAAAGL